ncbi:MAG: ATP-binding protein [Eubacterium sp.]
MTAKTFTKILSFGLGIVLATSILITFIFHTYYEKQAQTNLQSTASIVVSELNINEDYSFISNGLDNDTRLTLISKEGTVLADSYDDAVNMESHADRPEFQEAIKNGKGSTIRKSATLDKNTYYYALRLNNGNVLRVAVTSQSVFMAFYNSLVIIAAVMLAVMLISLAISFAITKSIVKPVTEMGKHLDEIESVETYEELQPFVDTIKAQREKQLLLDKQKKQFTANVSHELKTPLTSIAGYAELIENGMAKPENIKPFAHTIRKQALRLVSLTEDIIQLSQLDESNNDIVMESVDIYELAQGCCEALEMNAKAKNVSLLLKGKECRVKGNSSLLEELIYNLIDNAIRYNIDSGSVEISANKIGDKAILTVSDSGIGIPEKYQQRVFERFFRVDKSRSKETGGTGLGLAIVKHIAEIHNASISIHSIENTGTTIQIEF